MALLVCVFYITYKAFSLFSSSFYSLKKNKSYFELYYQVTAIQFQTKFTYQQEKSTITFRLENAVTLHEYKKNS